MFQVVLWLTSWEMNEQAQKVHHLYCWEKTLEECLTANKRMLQGTEEFVQSSWASNLISVLQTPHLVQQKVKPKQAVVPRVSHRGPVSTSIYNNDCTHLLNYCN